MFSYISRHIGTEFRHFLIHLGILTARIEQLLIKHNGNVDTVLLYALTEWRDGRRKEETFEKMKGDLFAALDEIGHKSLADDLLEKFFSDGNSVQSNDDAGIDTYAFAYGPGLSHGIVNEECWFTIVSKSDGAESLLVNITGPVNTPFKVMDNGDGTSKISYIPTVPGEYNIACMSHDQHVIYSPFSARITARNKQNGENSLVSSSLMGFCDQTLYQACWDGRTDLVKDLLQNNVDVNGCTNSGWTPLHAASHVGHEDIVKLLLQFKANHLRTDTEGVSALFEACSTGHANIVNMLLENGANVSQCKTDGWSPLIAASHAGHADIVQQLVKFNADVSHRDNEGGFALYEASWGGFTQVVKLLLEVGSDVSQTTKNGWTALIAAGHVGHKEIVQLLLLYNASVSQVSDLGCSALYEASWHGHTDVVKILLANGANRSQKTNSGWTALQAARSQGHSEIINLLLR